MSRKLLAIAVATAFSLTIAACSDSGDDDDGGGTTGGTGSGTGSGGGTTGGQPPVGGGTTAANPDGTPPAPSGAGAPSGDTKAGTYLGDFGFGQGVYVIDGDNALAGLSLMEDGSAISLFGEFDDANTFSGTLRQQEHSASSPATAGGFGTGDDAMEAVGPYALEFTPGASIGSNGGDVQANLSVASAGAIDPATLATVAGDWIGVNQFRDCAADATASCKLVFDVSFDGAAVSGTTSVELGNGDRTFEQPIVGNVAEYGDVLLLSFNWGEGERLNQYDGTAFFTTDGTGRLVFVGETRAAGVDLPTIASLLTKATP